MGTQKNLRVIGTTQSLSRIDVEQFKQNVLANKTHFDESNISFEIVEADMLQSVDCFSNHVNTYRPDYIIHTACPFM